MAIDLLEINGINYRVEVNMNTVENWENLSGLSIGQFEMEAAQSASVGVSTRAMLLWLFCAIIEGEELEGRTFEPDFREFKRMLRPSMLTRFAPIFLNQYMGKDADRKGDQDEVKTQNISKSLLFSLIKVHWVKWFAVIAILLCVILYFVKFS